MSNKYYISSDGGGGGGGGKLGFSDHTSTRPYAGYTGYDDNMLTGEEESSPGSAGFTSSLAETAKKGLANLANTLANAATDITRHARHTSGGERGGTFTNADDSGTQDPYTSHGVKYSPLHQQQPSYANTIAAAAAAASSHTGEGYHGYNIVDGHANSSSGLWDIDFTTLSDNDTISVNNSVSGDLPALVSLTYSSMPAMVIVGTLLIALAVATAFGNFLVGLALFKYRNLRTVSNYLIGNLACSDFLLAMTILPLSAVQECLGHWVFGEVMCYFWLCTDVLYCTASIWNLCIIAFDRFTATLYPMWYREKRSPKQAAIYIGIVWVFSIAICLPPLLGWNDLSGSYIYDNATNVHQCILFQTKSYVVYSAMGSFYIPFMFTVFLYIRIFGVLYMRMNKMKEATKARKATQARMTAPSNPPTVNPITAEATNPLCSEKGDIEMAPVVPTQQTAGEGGSGNTEELSSKSLFGSESEDESSSEKHPHNGSHPVKNGKVHKHKPHKEKGDKSETMVIFNPNHNFTTDSEKDDVKIVVCADKNGKNNNSSSGGNVSNNTMQKSTATQQNQASGGDKTASHKKHNISSLLHKPRSLFSSHNNSSSNNGSAAGNSTTTTGTGAVQEQKKKKRGSVRRRQDQREMRATIRMAIIIAFFCGCWIGFFTSYLIRGIVGDEDFHMPRALDSFFFWLGYSNSAMNPILYTIFNDDFRRAFQKILGCYTKRRHGNGPAYGKARS